MRERLADDERRPQGASTLQACNHFRILYQLPGGYEDREMQYSEKAMCAVVHYGHKLQKKLFDILLGWVKHKRALRCGLRRRCVILRERGGGRGVHSGFDGLMASRLLETEGRIGMAKEFHTW